MTHFHYDMSKSHHNQLSTWSAVWGSDQYNRLPIYLGSIKFPYFFLTFSWFEVFLSRVTDFYLTWKTELHVTGFPDFGWVGTLPILVTLKKPTFQSWSIRKITKRTIHYFSSTTSIHMEESICYILKWFFLASCPILSPSFKS